MRPPPCTDADDLLRCSAKVGNLGDMGRARHHCLGNALRALRTGQGTRALSMNPNCIETVMSGIEPGTLGVLGEC